VQEPRLASKYQRRDATIVERFAECQKRPRFRHRPPTTLPRSWCGRWSWRRYCARRGQLRRTRSPVTRIPQREVGVVMVIIWIGGLNRFTIVPAPSNHPSHRLGCVHGSWPWESRGRDAAATRGPPKLASASQPDKQESLGKSVIYRGIHVSW